MRLTSFTDFALRALMRLAGEPARSFATNEIASEFGISRNHLAKVVRDLADGGFIATQRGVGGGFSLARPPRANNVHWPQPRTTPASGRNDRRRLAAACV